LLHLLYLDDQVKRVPGIELNDRNEPIRCNRCGCQDKIKFKESSCFRCEERCFVCDHCLIMGRSKTCTPLFHFTSALTPVEGEMAIALSHPDVVPMKWTGQYTPAQQAGADACLDFIRHSEQREMLVWAVCGAGKTEIVFPAIKSVLQKGKRVLIATPRKDVVLELSPRIKQAFPSISIVTLHGDSVEKKNDGQLFVSTTHQVLRFYEMFDLIIIDEIDAFPFSADVMLHYAVRRALKQNGKWMYLSATPPRELQQRAQRGDVDHVIIPARHHRCPLPVPVYCQITELIKKIRAREPIPLLSEKIQQAVDSDRQLFLFVPRVEDVALVTQWVLTYHPYGVVAGTHAHDSERTDKVKLLREGKINIFITTTILERGVTVPRTDCLIFSSHHPIFNETSLVQMAGRVGRSSDFPDGNVWFVAEERTLAQKRAIEQIKRMNLIAKRDGFIEERR
ncbi:MAG: helicase-related protein, partial [Bacilli bacterium]